jgi:hypothetical protein
MISKRRRKRREKWLTSPEGRAYERSLRVGVPGDAFYGHGTPHVVIDGALTALVYDAQRHTWLPDG